MPAVAHLAHDSVTGGERAGLISVFGPGTKLVRAHDHAWLGTTDEQHAMLERWLAGELEPADPR